MLSRSTLLAFILLTSAAQAQDNGAADGPVKMTPEFCFTFPVVQMNKHDVSVRFPVMVNPVTVLKPGMVLRVIYVPPIQSDSNDLISAHHGTMEESYSRETGNTDAHLKNLPPEMAHEIDRQRKRVWEVPGNFVLAIAQYPTDVMHLVYAGSNTDLIGALSDTSFSFFDGMFIGSPNGNVQVLAVEKTSYAEHAGVKAGDEILAVGSIPMHDGNLPAFASAFASVKATAKENEQGSFPLTVRNGAGTRTVALSLPPSIKNFLNSGL